MSACSTLSSVIQIVALGKYVFDTTHHTLDLGLIGLAEFLPSAVLVLVTGAVADRFDKRRVAAIGQIGDGIAILGIAWYTTTHRTALWPIIIMVAIYGTSRAFIAPATRSMPPALAGEDMLIRVVPLTSLAWQATTIVGPVAAGFLYLINPTVPFLVAAAITVLAALMVLRVRYVQEPERSGKVSMKVAVEGFAFVRRSPLLLGAIALDLFAVLFGGAVALLPAIATDRLGVNAGGLGILRAAAGIGATVAGVALARRPIERRIGRVLLIVVGIFGVATIGLGLTRSFIVAAIMLAVLSAADMVSVYIRGTLVPLATPDGMRGRVTAVEQVFIGASNELGAFESGVAASILGTVGAIVSGGIATVAVVAIWWFRFPALRDVDSFEDVVAASATPSSRG